MQNPITNDVFDSRDLIEYQEHLQEELIELWNDVMPEGEEVENFQDIDIANDIFYHAHQNEIEHLEDISNFISELESSSDFTYGEAIIHESYFVDYCKEFVEDVGYIPNDLPSWIESHIDWDGVSDEIMKDYIEGSFEGNSYFIKA